MEPQQRIARSTGMMRVGGLLTACSAVAMFGILLIVEHIVDRGIAWIFLLLAFIFGIICGASLINALVVTRLLRAGSPSTIKKLS